MSLLFDLDLLNKDELYFLDDLKNKDESNFINTRAKEILLNNLSPDAFLCIKGEPLILFFNHQDRDIEEDKEVKIWNFNQSPIVFINEDSQWIIKNGFKILKNGSGLEPLNNSKLSDFEYIKIISGESWEKYQQNFRQEYRVDYYLLDSISGFRSSLVNDFKLESKIANSLIGRAIFIRYLIDRGIDLDRYRIRDEADFNNILLDKVETYKLFRKILDDFKGNLFPLSYIVNNRIINEEDEVTNEQLQHLTYLLHGGKLTRSTTLLSWINLYDFSIIPIEFISNIYERFIGQENQADRGAYYTPLFLVEYIENETVNLFYKQNPLEFNCKILDPACGSGIFLVETYRKIINQYKALNPGYNQNEDSYKEKLKELLKENIFGIDRDEDAVNIAIFSLYITLLDNLEPKSIKGLQFPTLLDCNFFTSDFFDLNAKFNSVLKGYFFQFILGNPPWKTKGHPKEKQLFEKYIEDRSKREGSNLEIENREIAEAFLIRVSDFQFGQAGLIVTSKILYKISRKRGKRGVFRNYFLNNFTLIKVIELSSVRHQIFNQSNDTAVAPATILLYKSEKDIYELRKNIIKHISLKPNIFFEAFKLMVIEKYDVKKIRQEYFIENDWIWKILVYGNILDFQFIKRLKENYVNVGKVIEDSKKFLIGQGVMEGGGDKNDFSKFVGYKYINTSKKDVKQFFIKYSDIWNNPIVHRDRNPELFEKNILLITGGLNNKFKSISAINYEKAIFKSSLTGIRAYDPLDVNILKSVSAILNSSFFSYYILLIGSSTGIEREETHDEEKWEVPFKMNQNIVELYNNVEKMAQEYYSAIMEDSFLKKQLHDAIEYLDSEVTNLFEPSNKEKSLIDYNNAITIPLLKGTRAEKSKIVGKIKYNDGILTKYAQVFINHFSKRFNESNYNFEVEILWSEYIIMMKFKITIEKSKMNNIVWSKLDNKKLIINITKLGFENLSDNLFLQKDIKGFEEDYFYLVKPNQYKSWHEAIAHLDLAEFIEAFFEIENKGI